MHDGQTRRKQACGCTQSARARWAWTLLGTVPVYLCASEVSWCVTVPQGTSCCFPPFRIPLKVNSPRHLRSGDSVRYISISFLSHRVFRQPNGISPSGSRDHQRSIMMRAPSEDKQWVSPVRPGRPTRDRAAGSLPCLGPSLSRNPPAATAPQCRHVVPAAILLVFPASASASSLLTCYPPPGPEIHS